jgi:hypothetical protein
MGAKVEQSDHQGAWVTFYLTAAAGRDLYRTTTQNQGLRLVLLVNDTPLGSVPITHPISDGRLTVFPELLNPADVDELVRNVNLLSAELQKQQ